MLKITFGKMQSDGSKAVYMKDVKTHKRIFCFWFHVKNDNPYEIRPTDAVIDMITKAGYKNLRDYFDEKYCKWETKNRLTPFDF